MDARLPSILSPRNLFLAVTDGSFDRRSCQCRTTHWDVCTSFNPKNVLGPISKKLCPPSATPELDRGKAVVALKRPYGLMRKSAHSSRTSASAAVSEIPSPSVPPKIDAPCGPVQKKDTIKLFGRHATGVRRTALLSSARPNTNRPRPRLSWIVGPPMIARLPVERTPLTA